jgi:hypothetical protein
MSGSVTLTGPVETPGAPQVTPVTLSTAINAALATNYAATVAETARAEAAEAALAAAQPWKLGTVTALGYGLGLYQGTLSVTFQGSEWQAGGVSTLGAGLALADGTLSVIGGGDWQAGVVTSLGTGLDLTSGVLSATGGGGGGGGDWGAGVVSTLGTGLLLDDGTLHVDADTFAAWADVGVAISDVSTDAQIAKTIATNVQTATTPPAFQTGIIIPYYQYVGNPYDDADFSTLLTLIRTYPQVPVIVVVNQTGDGGGGPGPYDAAMAQEIRMLQASGAAVAGYVSTINGTRDQSLVLADIASWRSLYPLTLIDAVFFDQMPYDVGEDNANIQLYITYYQTAHNAGYKLVIANPGSLQLSDWYSNRCADIYCCFEGNHWPVPADLSITPPSYFSGAITDYPVQHYAGLIYSSSWDASAYAALRPWLHWIYATDSPSPASSDNPWGALSSYLADLFAAAAEGDVTATSLRTGGTAGPTWTAGAGAPGSVQPNGSLYSRSDGTTGSRLYVSAGGGSWHAVAGV